MWSDLALVRQRGFGVLCSPTREELPLLVFLFFAGASERIMLSTYLTACSVFNQLRSESKQDFTVTVSFSLY